MFSGHAQNHLYDTLAFAILLLSLSFIAALIGALLQEKRLGTRATVRQRNGRNRDFKSYTVSAGWCASLGNDAIE